MDPTLNVHKESRAMIFSFKKCLKSYQILYIQIYAMIQQNDEQKHNVLLLDKASIPMM